MRRTPNDKSGKPILPPAIKPVPESRVIGGQRIAMVTQTRSYELITPLFGGGAEPGRADSDVVIRGSGIRGQLRFWWRACRGGRFGNDLRAMRKAENLLWGAASTSKEPRPSQVDAVVKVTDPGEPRRPFVLRGREGRAPVARPDDNVALPYAAFPLQPREEDVRRYRMNTPASAVLGGVKFDLTVTFPETERTEVEAALWAWETFGGVGGRTRRGFGALRLTAVNGRPVKPPEVQRVESAIRKGLRKHVIEGEWPGGVPRLSANLKMVITRNHKDPKDAWDYLVGRLRDFRQARYGSVEKGKPGRSRWPEPDEIRRLTTSRSSMHSKQLSHVRKFPRAAFGLPIVFHFKDQRAGDPDTTTLQGSDRYERLASPLILRPVACEGGKSAGLAAVLEGTSVAQMPEGLILKESQRQHGVKVTLTKAEAAEIRPLAGNSDVLDAFLKTL